MRIIAPIHVSDDGEVSVENILHTVFNVYDKDYLNDLLKEENILYTKDGKDIAELLSQGREVPKSHRNDVFTYNIGEEKTECQEK